jgi:hypothetical protein
MRRPPLLLIASILVAAIVTLEADALEGGGLT